MRKGIRIGIFEEAREFHLKLWETPSFLFFLMGFFTILLMYITYELARRFGEPEIIIISETIVTITAFSIGFFFVNGISKMIIVNRANYDFISLATHELRTPLAGVKWSLRAALDGDFGELSPSQRNLLFESYESNERMILLVSDLLSISRIESGRFAYDFSYEDIIPIIQETARELAFEAQQKKVTIVPLLPEASVSFPRVRIDKVKIKLVFQNLITNAIRYNIPNGTVTISPGPTEDGRVDVVITDTGIGIPQNEHEKIFSRFFRGKKVVEAGETVGSGLGLYLVKKIIDAHNGTIWFASEENKGTTFHIVLPT